MKNTKQSSEKCLHQQFYKGGNNVLQMITCIKSLIKDEGAVSKSHSMRVPEKKEGNGVHVQMFVFL